MTEAIILAGGLGTRLRDTVPGIPKTMAPVAGRPFLFYVINYLRSQGTEKFIFSLGHMHEMIESYLDDQFSTLDYQCSIEDEPLGTGGAIRLAISKATEKDVLIVNGDTLFKADLQNARRFHVEKDAETTILLKPMKTFDRYGVIEMDEANRAKDFREKQFYESGNINGGTYIININKFWEINFPEKFSFETDYLEKYCGQRLFYGLVDDAYFIDIGIPGDYERAQSELGKAPLDLSVIDKDWTVFIDRDGVINHEKKEDYILNWSEFQFYEGVREAMAKLTSRFGKIIIVSNQRGVGRGLMTEADLGIIHEKMRREIVAAGGRVDEIYYCSSTDSKHPDRKPNPGMAFRARNEIPGVDLSKSVMLGNKLSDMRFAKNAGMYAIFLATTNPDIPYPHPDIDLRFNSLPDFVNSL